MIDIELIEKAKEYGVIDVLKTSFIYSNNYELVNIPYNSLNTFLDWFIEYKEKYSKNYYIKDLIKYNRKNFVYVKMAKLDIKDFTEYMNYLNERENINNYNIVNKYFDYLENMLALKEDEELTYEEKYPKNLLTKKHIMEKKVKELFEKDSGWEIKF